MDYAIALTGGISTGKSTASNILKLYGFKVIDADEISHKILDEESEKIIEIFGDEYVKNGKVDRKKLGGVIFNDKDKKKKLESLLHPLIRKEIEKRAAKSEEQGVPYFIDIPLFYETNAYNIKNVLVVYATKELQLERLVKRDGFSYEDANSRIDSQISIEEKKKLATYVVDNTKDLGHLTNELENFRRKISADFKI